MSLGFAHIVPYGKEAQFQIGYKGLIQLAIRSGQYSRINATPVFEGELEFHDKLTSDIRLDATKKKSNKIVGYVAYFRMVSGFEHAVYWDEATVMEHGKRYSKSFSSQYSPWQTNFEKMALKTVIRDLLSHWGMLTVQMQRALIDDSSVRTHIDADATFPDLPALDAPKSPDFGGAPQTTAAPTTAPAPAAKKKAAKAAPAPVKQPEPVVIEAAPEPEPAPEPAQSEPEPEPELPVQAETGVDTPISRLGSVLFEKDIDDTQVVGFLASKGAAFFVEGSKAPYALKDIRPDKIENLINHIKAGSTIAKEIAAWGKEVTP